MNWVDYIKHNSNVSQTNCWEWKGKKNESNQPVMSGWHNNGETFKEILVSKVAYYFDKQNKVSVPLEHLKIRHNCNTKHCANPNHIEEA